MKQGQQVVNEMKALVPHADHLAITVARVVKLEEGLLASTILIDGLPVEYQLLRPCLVIGCRALASVDGQSIDEDKLFKLVIDALFDARAVVVATAPFPGSGIGGEM